MAVKLDIEFVKHNNFSALAKNMDVNSTLNIKPHAEFILNEGERCAGWIDPIYSPDLTTRLWLVLLKSGSTVSIRTNNYNGIADSGNRVYFANNLSWETQSGYKRIRPIIDMYQFVSGSGVIHFDFNANFPIFTKQNEALAYIDTGVIGESCVNAQTKSVAPTSRYYIRNWLYKIDDVGTKALDEALFRNYLIEEDAKLYFYYNDNEPYNLTLKTTSAFIKYTTTINDIHNWIDATNLDRTTFSYGDFVLTGQNYKGILATNIPIFKNKNDGDKYEAGELDISASVNGGLTSNSDNVQNITGEEITDMEIDEKSFETGYFFNTYILNSTDIEEIASFLMSSDTDLINLIKAGVYLWGNNPIDVVMDCYCIPFDPRHEFNITTRGASVYFGNFNATTWDDERHLGQYSKLLGNTNHFTIVNEYIFGTYNDFRDITNCEYNLYLPFLGVIKLDPTIYVYSLLTVDAKFDVNSHTLKYYIKSNDKLVESYECSVGVEMPLSGTDFIGKMTANINSISQVASATSSLADTLKGGDVFGGLTNTATNMINATINLNKDAGIKTKGNSSSNTAMYDIKYPFLMITTIDSIKPNNLNEQYNYPSYYIDKLINSVGYTVAENVKLNSSATETEHQEIINLIQSGIYI